MNHDGKADLIAVDEDALYVALSNGGNAFSAQQAWTAAAFYGTRGTYVADVTGDGRVDAIAVNNGGDFVMSSTGSAFAWAGQWSGPFYSQP